MLILNLNIQKPRSHRQRQSDMITFIFNGQLRLPATRATVTVGDGMWACQATKVKNCSTLNKYNIFVFVTYTIIQSVITNSEICALHLTHPSAHTPGAVGCRGCGVRGAVGGSVPCSRVSPQIRTHDVTSPTLYPLGHDCPFMQMNSEFRERQPIGVKILSAALYVTVSSASKTGQISGAISLF